MTLSRKNNSIGREMGFERVDSFKYPGVELNAAGQN